MDTKDNFGRYKHERIMRRIVKRQPLDENLTSAAYTYMRLYKGKFYICPICANVFMQNAKFCDYCGARVEG